MSEENSNKSFKFNDYSDECLKIKNLQALKVLGITDKNDKSDNLENNHFNYSNFENNQEKAPCIPPWAKTWRKAVGYSKFQHKEIKTENTRAGEEISTRKRKVTFIGAHEDVFIFGLKPVQRKKDLFYFKHPSTKSKQVFDKRTSTSDATKPNSIDHTELYITEKSDKCSLYKEEISLEKTNMQEEIDRPMADVTDLTAEVTQEKELHNQVEEVKEYENSLNYTEIGLKEELDFDTAERQIKSHDDEQNEDLLKEGDHSEETSDLKEIIKVNEERVDQEKYNKDIEKEQNEIKKEVESVEDAERETQEKEEVMKEKDTQKEEETADTKQIEIKKDMDRDSKETTEQEVKGAEEMEKTGAKEIETANEELADQAVKEGDAHETEQVITENEFLFQEGIQYKILLDTEKVLEEDKDLSTFTEKRESLHEKSYEDIESSILLLKERQQADSKTKLSNKFMEETVYEVEDKKGTGQNLDESFNRKKTISTDSDTNYKKLLYGKRKASLTTAESVSLQQTKHAEPYHVPTSNEAYLRAHLGKHLVTALSQVAYKRPADPIHYLAQFLYKQRFNLQERQEYHDEQENLMLLRECNKNKQKVIKSLNIIKLQNTTNISLKMSAQVPINKTEGNETEIVIVNDDNELKQNIGSEL